MILFNSDNKTFYLETEKTSYIMRILENGYLYHCYYGRKIGQDEMKYHTLFKNLDFASVFEMEGTRASLDSMPQECSTRGRGDYRTPSVCVENEFGQSVNELVYKTHQIIDGKPKFAEMPQLDADEHACQTLEVVLEDVVNGFDVSLYYSVFEKENIIARRTVIRNGSNKELKILSVASLCLDLENCEMEMVSLEGAWGRERHIERYPLHHGVTSIESRRGASSHQLNPFAALVTPNTTEDCGEVYATTLVYSGDFKILAEKDHYGNTRFLAGLNPETFCWVLESGETFVSPEALLTYSSEGLGAMSHSFHEVCRGYLGKSADKNIKHPIVINNWEAMYFDISEEKLCKFIEDCKGLGIDTMVLDDGWFGHRMADNSSLGDWFVDQNRFPEGLHKVVQCCKDNGMKFGIWFEPEMISEDSELYRQHPDWCIHAEGFKNVEARQQLVLDMSRKEICDAIYDQMAKILTEYDISYVKWDMNRHITDNGSAGLSAKQQGEHSHRYILGVYSLMDRLVRNFPHVFFEGCSGGGGRFDFGILYYMPQIWTSDDSDAMERLKIQYGTSLVYPTSSMVAHVSACPNHQTGRVTPFKTRGDVAQICNFGYELNVGMLSDEEKDMIKEQTARHRQIESLIMEGDFYRLRSPFEENVCAWQLVSKDKKTSYAVYARNNAVPNYKPEYLKFKGLDPEQVYCVEQLGIEVKGSTLMYAGVPVLIGAEDYKTITFDITMVEAM